MSRKTKTRDYPRYVHPKHGALWYVRDKETARLAGHKPWERLADIDDISGMHAALAKFTNPQALARAEGALSVVDMLERALPIICKGKAAETRRHYSEAAHELQRRFPVGDIDQMEARHFFAVRNELKEQPAIFNLLRTVLRLAFEWALEMGVGNIKGSPIHTIKRLKTHKRSRYIDDAEYRAIYEAGDDLSQIVQELCYRTGQRIADVLMIQESDCDAEGVEVIQGKVKGKALGATGTRVTIKWSPELRAVVARARALVPVYRGNAVVEPNVVGIDPYLLKWCDGDPYGYDKILEHWTGAVERASVNGVPVTNANIHDLRAKAATDTYRRHGIEAARQLLGHTTQAQTMTYLRKLLPNVVEGPTAGIPRALSKA